jgi:hypothetical protein
MCTSAPASPLGPFSLGQPGIRPDIIKPDATLELVLLSKNGERNCSSFEKTIAALKKGIGGNDRS